MSTTTLEACDRAMSALSQIGARSPMASWDPVGRLLLRAEGLASSDIEGIRVAPRRLLAARCRRATLEGRWAATIRFLSGPSVLIVDELGYLPMPAEDAAALFQVISRRYLKGSVILTTNRGVASSGDTFTDTTIAAALLDRLLHKSVVINIDGDSYRLRAHQVRARKRRPKGGTD